MHTFELTDEQIELIIRTELQDQLNYIKESLDKYGEDPELNWMHPDDIPYNIKIAKALKRVISHYGG
jgi:hypothetical protein